MTCAKCTHLGAVCRACLTARAEKAEGARDDARALWNAAMRDREILEQERDALRAVYEAAREWLDHLREVRNGQYADGVPGDLMDAVEAYERGVDDGEPTCPRCARTAAAHPVPGVCDAYEEEVSDG